MAKLPSDPKDVALEDLVAAHFASRGAYGESGVTERNPIDILELDVVWTDYAQDAPRSHPFEVKSGKDIRSCLSTGGKVQRIIIRRSDVTYAAFFTCPKS